MPALKHVLVVAEFIRKLRGESQPILVKATDGLPYVVKFFHDIQEPDLLFNEAIGSELYRAFGLPVPEWRPILVTESFLDHNSACWFQTEAGHIRPIAGLCFGSRFVGGAGETVLEILPGSYFHRVSNRTAFGLAWLVDLCALHSDHRQAVFVERELAALEAVFIDFGHMFGNSEGDHHPKLRATRYLDERIYVRPATISALTVRSIAINVVPDRLWQQRATVPDEWKCENAEQNFAACLNRLSDSRFVERAFEVMVNSFGPSARDKLSPP